MIWISSDNGNWTSFTILEFLIGISSRDRAEPDQTKWVSDSLQTLLHLSEGKTLFMLIFLSCMHTAYTFTKSPENKAEIIHDLKRPFHSYFFSFAIASLWSVGLWAATNDLQSFCRIYTQILRQEEEDALFLWCNHSGGNTALLCIDEILLIYLLINGGFWITF